jgi:hypothetical protein
MSTPALRAVLALALARRPPFSLSTQKRTLYFCGPKSSDHDATYPITEHYYARLRSHSDAVHIAESLMTAVEKDAAASAVESRLRPVHAAPSTKSTVVTMKVETLEEVVGRGGVGKGQVEKESEVLRGMLGRRKD